MIIVLNPILRLEPTIETVVEVSKRAPIMLTMNQLLKEISELIHHHLTDAATQIPDATAIVYLADCMYSISGINSDRFCGDVPFTTAYANSWV